MSDKELQQKFVLFLAKKSGAKTLKDLENYIKNLGEDGLKKARDEFYKEIQKAAHGTKLQYVKSLKNKCNEDEKLVYYRKGGHVECGCAKKEDGGSVKRKTKNAIDKFKERVTQDKKLEKDCGGSKFIKKGGEVCPKCGKVHKAGIGCAVAKFKAYKLGGSLNGIPFIKTALE